MEGEGTAKCKDDTVEIPDLILTSPSPSALSHQAEFGFQEVNDGYVKGYLDQAQLSGSYSSLESLGKEDEIDHNYNDLLLKPPPTCEQVLKEDYDDENSVARSASVRSAPADSTLNLESETNGSPVGLDSPRLKRKTAIRRHSTVSNRRQDGVEGRSPNISRSDSAASPNLSRSADWRPNKPRSLLDVQEEYFTLNIELVGCKETVKHRVEHGTSLRYIVSQVAKDHSFDADNVDVFVESSQTPFPVDTPTYALAKRNLYIRSKAALPTQIPSSQNREDINYTSPQRNGGSMAGPADTIPDDFTNVGGGRRKDLTQFLGVNNPNSRQSPNNRRLSVPGVPRNEKFDPKAFALQEKLDQYDIHGIPKLPIRILSIGYRSTDHDEELFELEDTWRRIVEDVPSMEKKDQELMEAIWEILKTENRCIKNLKIIIDLYMCTLLNLQTSSLLNGIQTEKIFANIIEIEQLHIDFWKDHVMKCLTKLRTERKPLCADDIHVVFKDFSTLFTPYFKFCPEEGHCLDVVRSLTEEDPLFRQYLMWCEKRRDCERKKLADLLVYPMQRLTKYPLLLSAVAKKTTDDRMKIDIQARAYEVDHFIRRINHEVTRHQEQSRLDNALSRIEGYEGIHIPSGCDELSKLADEYASLDLSATMPFAKIQQSRWLLYENSMKIRDQDGRHDVYVFLFTDALVITKQSKKGDKYKVIKPPLKIDKLHIQELKDKTGFAAVCVNDYGCANYGFIAYTGGELFQKWMDKIAKAKELYNFACTEDTDDFLDNVSISQSSEPTDTSSGMSVEVETPTGSPTASPVPSPKTPHRRITTSMFEMSPPSIPDVLKEEVEEDRPQEVTSKEQERIEENGSTEEPLEPSNVPPKDRVPPIPMQRSLSEEESKKTPPPVSPKPKLNLSKSFSNSSPVHERSEKGSFHNIKYEQNAAQTIMPYDSDEDETCTDPPSSMDPYINPDLQHTGRYKKKTPTPAKRSSHPHRSPHHSPHRFVSATEQATCKVNNHQIMKQCHLDDNGTEIVSDTSSSHGDKTLTGSSPIMSHC